MLDILQWDPYTPTKVEDIVGNQEIWQNLAESIRSNTCSHILLCGPPGCGKSLFLRILLEYERTEKHSILTIDCTANSGLRDLRDSIRGFSRGSRTPLGHFRWIILEHADSLAADTQAFLRRMMETTSKTTRFLFECNEAGAISEPIVSRSILYTVNAPTEMECVYELKRRTDFQINDQITHKLFVMTGGNLRNAVYSALAIRWNKEESIANRYDFYQELLKQKPLKDTWIAWAIAAEKQCRLQGYDCREILQVGWPGHPAVSYMRSQWSRLGGISSRAIFYRAMHQIMRAE